MMKMEEKKRLDDIIDGASKLSVENQEYILTTINGMLFTRNLLMKHGEQMAGSQANNRDVKDSITHNEGAGK